MLTLWYQQPAKEGHAGWEEEALPLGNGQIGCKVFGGIEQERIQLNEKSLWRGTVLDVEGNTNGNGKGDCGKSLTEIRQLLREKKYEEARKQMERLQGDEIGLGAFQNLGDLWLQFPALDQEKCRRYSRGLSLEEASAWTAFYIGSNYYWREYFVSYPGQAAVIRQTGSRMELKLSLTMAQPVESMSWQEDGCMVTGRVGAPSEKGLCYALGMKVETDGSVQVLPGNDGIRILDADEVNIYVSAVTDYGWEYPSYREADLCPEKEVSRRLKKAAEQGYEKLYAEHLQDYQPIFKRVSLSLSNEAEERPTDQLLSDYQQGRESRRLEELLFQYGRYLLIASSRQGALPANLQGIWNDSNEPAWQSDYHLNINLQMNYWPALNTNLPETMQPLFDYVNKCLVVPGRRTAYAYTGIGDPDCVKAEGWMAHTQNNIFGHTGPGSWWHWGWAPTVGAFLLQNTYEYFRFTQNVEMLETQIYPAMEECARMWSRLLIEEEESGQLLASPCFSPEHGPVTAGNAFDQTMIWQLYQDTLEAAQALLEAGRAEAVDRELMEKLKLQVARIVPCQAGDWGQIREWREEDEWPNRGFDTMDVQYHHRHFSHLMGLYPGHYITKERPELMKAAKVSLLDRGEEGPSWSMALRLGLWARLGCGNDCHRYLKELICHNTFPNLWGYHPPFQIDGNFGASAGIGEMLLQSTQEKDTQGQLVRTVITLLPALPDVWQEGGSFTGLAARGGYTVDAFGRQGKITRAVVKAVRSGRIRLQYNGEEADFSVKAGETRKIEIRDTESMEKTQHYKLAQKHLPVLYRDAKEPFSLLYIGYTVFTKQGISASTGRRIDPAGRKAEVCIEYAYYYDYDIQHLYDLEHLWVYLDAQERVCGCECSFHGMYLNAMLPGMDILHGENRVHMYVQPGKHAFLPDPALFHLFIDFWESCGELAGKDGILTPAVIPGMPNHSREEDKRMESSIRERFAFVPADQYEKWETDAKLTEWEMLKAVIPGRIKREMEQVLQKTAGVV